MIERLVHEERKQTERCQAGSETGLFSKNRKRQGNARGQGYTQNKGKDQGPKGPVCYNCKSVGHIKRNCPMLKKGGERAQKAEGDISIVAAESALMSSSVRNTRWIIDSGATSHMCCDDKLFKELQPLQDSVKVSIGDGYELVAVGIG